MKTLLILLLIFTQVGYANQATDIKKDQPAPYDGVIMDKEKANNVKNELIEKDGLEKTNESLQKTITLYGKNQDLYEQKSDMLLKQNIELTKSLNDTRKMNDLEKIGLFVLGVAVTGLAVYGASRLK